MRERECERGERGGWRERLSVREREENRVGDVRIYTRRNRQRVHDNA